MINMINLTVTSYITDENCSILLACGADQDVKMSLTMKHIRDNDAQARCTYVFTKANILPAGKMTAICEILSGKMYPLGGGWFITKQLSQQEPDAGVDHYAAREREKRFFATAPWSDKHSLRGR